MRARGTTRIGRRSGAYCDGLSSATRLPGLTTPGGRADSLGRTCTRCPRPPAGTPRADLQRAQRRSAIELLELELDEFAPRRVLALTGGWIGPFWDGLGLNLTARSGRVEAVGMKGDCAWVVAKHPMMKPEGPFVRGVLAE